jgi:hypothetical protein
MDAGNSEKMQEKIDENAPWEILGEIMSHHPVVRIPIYLPVNQASTSSTGPTRAGTRSSVATNNAEIVAEIAMKMKPAS